MGLRLMMGLMSVSGVRGRGSGGVKSMTLIRNSEIQDLLPLCVRSFCTIPFVVQAVLQDKGRTKNMRCCPPVT